MSGHVRTRSLLLFIVFNLIALSGHSSDAMRLPFHSDWSPSDWRLEITLEKSEYLPGEAVWVDFVLTNVSADTMFIDDNKLDPNNYNLSFNVVTGNDTLPVITYPNSRPVWPVWLLPNGALDGSVDVCSYYGEPVEGEKWRGWLLRPGSYSLQAIALGDIPSNPLEFEVLEPSGKEAEIYNTLHRARILWAQHRREAVAGLLFPLLPRATKSVYSDQIYALLRLAVGLDYPKAAEVGIEALEINPNSRYARIHLVAVFCASTPEQGRQYVESLERESPGSRAAVLGRKLLKEFKEWNMAAGAQ
jgi:hypothetical protein